MRGEANRLVADAAAIRTVWIDRHRPHAAARMDAIAGLHPRPHLAHPLCWEFRCPCGQALVIWVARDAGGRIRVRAHGYAHS